MSNVILFALLFFPISFTPGPNMLLVLSFGMSVGYKRTLCLIFGGVMGFLCVVSVCGAGIGAIFARNELLFKIFMCLCAVYLGYLAFKMWYKAQNIECRAEKVSTKFKALFFYGFTSCLSNPKTWTVFSAILPPFLDKNDPLNIQFALIVVVVAFIELFNMCLYMFGGVMLRKVLTKHAILLQKISASFLALIAVFMLVTVFFNDGL